VPQFGKTLLGLIVQKAKVGEESSLPYIKEIRDILIQYIPYLIVKFKCDAVIWVPHTIKRRVPLQDFLAKELKLCIPIIPVTKIVIKDIVPQKTLSELNRRLENATLTNHVTESVDTLKRYTNVLIIDDAIGSGATIQAIGCNLKNLNQHLNIFALAIVGSYKGFDVIKDI
jgi:predicted amidophosphoribosyltransferase